MQRARRLVDVAGLAVVGIFLGAPAADAQRAAPMSKVEITVAGHPNALCNDGSPPILCLFNAPRNVAETEYQYGYGRQVRDSLAAVAPAYFVADSGRHTVLLVPQFGTVSAGGQTLGTVLHNWYFGTPGPVVALAPGPGTPESVR